MYYVNHEQLELRLQCIPTIAQALREIQHQWDNSLLLALAQERALHLAIEVVTDIGSYLIDAFIMRDASSYEDIIEINAEERVFPEQLKGVLLELVRLRRPLVQEYYQWTSHQLHPLVQQLPDVLIQYELSVRSFIQRELAPFA